MRKCEMGSEMRSSQYQWQSSQGVDRTAGVRDAKAGPRFTPAQTALHHDKVRDATEFLCTLLHGKETALRLALLCFFAGGHLLIEDLPGLGKTTLALAIAKTLGLTFGRVQCTSDLLPSDITGLSMYNKKLGVFEFHAGPVFNNILLVDEINRATPKTQSALLEAMEENQVTVEGKTHDLPIPFFVIATQNPLEHFGTFPLPESQIDRFMMKIDIGYPSRQAEKEILQSGSRRKDIHAIQPLLNRTEVLEIQASINDGVYISDKILDYVLDLVAATRASKYLVSGLSTRGSLAITATARTAAFLEGRDFVIPEDVKRLAPNVAAHRVQYKEEYDHLDRGEIIQSLLEDVPVPA
jgi:MoxR-like ATPase